MSMSMSQQQALVTLLEDTDVSTINLLKTELIQAGPSHLVDYQSLREQLHGRARKNLDEIIQKISGAESLGNISRGLAGLENFAQMEDLSWELARAEQPSFVHGPYQRQLDQWAERVDRLLRPGASSREKIACLVRVLSQEEQLVGNSYDYNHPRNCYLPWVMEFRCGLPITLTLIYLLVGQRVGIKVEGLGVPGHFLARIGDIVFDPYYSGRLLSEGAWELIVSEIQEAHRPQALQAITPARMMHRLLINLRNAHIKRNDVVRRTLVDQYLAVLQH